MVYTNSRVIIRWWNPDSNKILLTTSLRFDEENFVNDGNEEKTGCLKESVSKLDPILETERLRYETVSITDHPFIESDPKEFSIKITI